MTRCRTGARPKQRACNRRGGVCPPENCAQNNSPSLRGASNVVAEGVRYPATQKLAFARRQILQQSPTLIVHLYFSSTLSLCTFLKKVPKTGQLCPAFGASFVQESLCDIFQSVRTSSVAACHNAWGGKNSLRSNIMPPVSKHCSAARCASQRCPPAVGGELPFARHFLTPRPP